MYPFTDYDRFSKPELSEALDKRGLRTIYHKAAMVASLIDYDKTQSVF